MGTVKGGLLLLVDVVGFVLVGLLLEAVVGLLLALVFVGLFAFELVVILLFTLDDRGFVFNLAFSISLGFKTCSLTTW